MNMSRFRLDGNATDWFGFCSVSRGLVFAQLSRSVRVVQRTRFRVRNEVNLWDSVFMGVSAQNVIVCCRKTEK